MMKKIDTLVKHLGNIQVLAKFLFNVSVSQESFDTFFFPLK